MFNKGSIIRTGICSYGMSGKLFHAPFLDAHPGYDLSAIVERHHNDSRERYPSSKLYRSVEELCMDPKLDLIIVNTPTHLHFEHARAVLHAGKHMVIEKPFAITVKEAQDLAQLAEEKSLFLSIYQNRRYDGDYGAVKNVIDNGLLGELREAEIRYDVRRVGGRTHHDVSQ